MLKKFITTIAFIGFISLLLFSVKTKAAGSEVPNNQPQRFTNTFKLDSSVYFKRGAATGKFWKCVNNTTGLGNWVNLPNAVDTIYQSGDSIHYTIGGVAYAILNAPQHAVDTIYRTPGIDSIFFSIDGVTYAILDSAGGGITTIDTSNFWNITGNTGTNPATDFVGTTDSTKFIIQPDSGNVGIGIRTPLWKFQVNTNTFAGISTDQYTDGLLLIQAKGSAGLGVIAIGDAAYGQRGTSFSLDDNIRYANLDCDSLNNYGLLRQQNKIEIQDGTQGAGKVLTSDANGLASWQYEDSLIVDSVATTGDTTQLAGNAFVAIIATGAITDLVLRFPATPYNNMTVVAKFDYAVTTLTADGNGYPVHGFPSSTALGQHREWKFNATTGAWY